MSERCERVILLFCGACKTVQGTTHGQVHIERRAWKQRRRPLAEAAVNDAILINKKLGL